MHLNATYTLTQHLPLGPAQDDPLRCRKTGRYLQYKAFNDVLKVGGLKSLPILKGQGATVRTGEINQDETSSLII